MTKSRNKIILNKYIILAIYFGMNERDKVMKKCFQNVLKTKSGFFFIL